MESFENLGVIKNQPDFDEALLNQFEGSIATMREKKAWTKEQLVSLFHTMLPGFAHQETGKYLDGKM